MTTTIDQAFVTQFEREVHMAYQRKGSLIRNTVRTKNNVKGSTVRFQKAGTGNAGNKSRHGDVPIMNADRTYVEATMSDRYAGEYIDKLDELKIEHDERAVVTDTIAAAMGRDTDEFLLTAMDATTNANNVTTAFTWTAASGPLSFMEAMGKSNVPFDGGLYSVICWQAWADLMDIDEFNRMEYVGANDLWHEGVSTAKKWLGFIWYPHSGLQLDGGNDAKQFFYHRTGVGHGIAKDMSLDITWQGQKQAHLAVGSMSQGAIIIDSTSVIENVYDITP